MRNEPISLGRPLGTLLGCILSGCAQKKDRLASWSAERSPREMPSVLRPSSSVVVRANAVRARRVPPSTSGDRALEWELEASHHERDVIGGGGEELIRAAKCVAIPAAERRWGDDAESDFIADDDPVAEC
jgi:hypothetical protein